MKKTENLRSMIEGRIADLEKQIAKFDPVVGVTYTAYELWLDEEYKEVSVAGETFRPSQVLRNCLQGLEFHYRFCDWARSLDKETIPEYMQMVDELEQNKEWLKEVK